MDQRHPDRRLRRFANLGARQTARVFRPDSEERRDGVRDPAPKRLQHRIHSRRQQRQFEQNLMQPAISAARLQNLYFGPAASAGMEGRWIKTAPSRGWFAYIRIYGPEAAAFNGSWKPNDIEEVK
jgi:hypothetical protein